MANEIQVNDFQTTIICPVTGQSAVFRFESSDIYTDVETCECCGTSVKIYATAKCSSCGQYHDVKIS